MTRRPHLAPVAALIALSLATRPAAAQRVADRSTDLRAQLAALPGSAVRVSRGGALVEGYALNVRGDTLLLRAADDMSTVAVLLSETDTLWTRKGNAGRGAAIGAVLGGLGLGAFGVMVGSGLCESSSCGSDIAELGILSTAVGLAGGALVGAVAGSFVRTWHRLGP